MDISHGLQSLGSHPSPRFTGLRVFPPARPKPRPDAVNSLWFHALTALVCGLCCVGTVRAEPLTGSRDKVTQVTELKNSRVSFFSSVEGTAFACLEFGTMGAAHHKVGPFRIATPGVAISQPKLSINATPCTAADWSTLTSELLRFQPTQLSEPLVVALPDKRELVTVRFPRVRGQQIIFDRAQMRAEDGGLGRPQAVLVAFTGDAAQVMDFGPSPRPPGSYAPTQENPHATPGLAGGAVALSRAHPLPHAP